MTATTIRSGSVCDRPARRLTMARSIESLNRRYAAAVACRGLCDPETVASWRGRRVRVFLRHESDHVFAIAAEDCIGMADYVGLTAVSFDVDEPGRLQACAGLGPLPNGRNVHAFLTGTLLWAGMTSRWNPPVGWQEVVYRPHQMKHFQFRSTQQPVQTAPYAVCTPHPVQVWCPRHSTAEPPEVLQ